MNERNVKVTLEKAQEWYNSTNNSLKEIALQAFTEEELQTNCFRNIKTFEDACKILNLNIKDTLILLDRIKCYSIASAASFKLNIVRNALNKGYKLDFIKGDLWHPYTPCCLNDNTFKSQIKDNILIKIARISINNELFLLVGGNAYIGWSSGLGTFSSLTSVGYSYADVGFLGCATKEIAVHFGKYFAKDIFDAKYGDLLQYTWIEL